MTKKKDPAELLKVGRPTKYTPELADLICERVAIHDVGLSKLTKMFDDMPDKSNINKWRRKYPDFRVKYAQAKCEQIEFLTEDILEIADDATNDWMEFEEKTNGCESWKVNGEHIQRSRLRIDTRKWLAAKLAPKIYGDVITQQLVNNVAEDTFAHKHLLDEKNKKDY
jgi:hypothetical protein